MHLNRTISDVAQTASLLCVARAASPWVWKVAQAASLSGRSNAIELKAGWQPALRKPTSESRVLFFEQAGWKPALRRFAANRFPPAPRAPSMRKCGTTEGEQPKRTSPITLNTDSG